MTARGYTASFGVSKAGLANVQRAWIGSNRNYITGWAGPATELQSGSGIYAVHESAPSGAYWIVWRTGESSGERFLAAAINDLAYTFNFGSRQTGKSVGYTYLSSDFGDVGSEITDDINEWLTTGIFLATASNVPVTAMYARARTIEASPVYGVVSLTPPEIATVTPVTYTDDRVNMVASIIDYLKTHQFKWAGSATTINSKYPSISFGLGFPDLEKLEPPHLGVKVSESGPRRTYTWERSEKPYTAHIYGFCGGLRGGDANAMQLDQLLSDVENLFDEPSGGQNVVPLLDLGSGSEDDRTTLSELRISDVVGGPIEAGSDETLDVSKYRFRVTMTVGLWKSQ